MIDYQIRAVKNSSNKQFIPRTTKKKSVSFVSFTRKVINNCFVHSSTFLKILTIYKLQSDIKSLLSVVCYYLITAY